MCRDNKNILALNMFISLGDISAACTRVRLVDAVVDGRTHYLEECTSYIVHACTILCQLLSIGKREFLETSDVTCQMISRHF